MSNFKWSPYLGSASYVLDIVTGSGNTQMYLGLAYGSVDSLGTGLTQTDADNTAAAMRTAVNGLTGVTGSTLTAFSNPGGYLLFDSAAYANFQLDLEIPDSFASPDHVLNYLVTASPADGILSSGDLSTVTAAVRTYMLGMSNVVSCTVTQLTVTPATL